jgi:hypothetical protein
MRKKTAAFFASILIIGFFSTIYHPVLIKGNVIVSNEQSKQYDSLRTLHGGPQLDFSFIYQVVENLSNIVKQYPQGRDFGTPGEHYARDLIKGWMQEIGLQNVHIDKITGEWTKQDSWQNFHNFLLDPDFYTDPWIEELDLKKNFTKWYLHVKVYDKNNNIVDERNFSKEASFPFLKEEKESQSHNVTMQDVRIFDDFQIGGVDGIILIEADWRDPYGWWTSNLINLKRQNVKCFILMDCFDDTIFMMPSGTSSPAVARFSKPGFSINGSNGKWIKKYLSDSEYIVKADFCSEWTWERVESWNVIGEIPGNSSKIAILNNFYDGWWNQAACDGAQSVGLILGIAKYLKDHNITPELTLRFIAWGGHEWYFRGVKHYLKNTSIKIYGHPAKHLDGQEDIKYVINPGNFGFNYTNNMSFNVAHEQDDALMKFMQEVARELNYSERTGIGITGEYSVFGTEGYRFYHGHRFPERYCHHAIEFDRFPFPGYHRDGNNHTLGDVFREINDSLYRVDCEVIAEIILRLTVPKLRVTITAPQENSFYFRNIRLFSLQKNTVVYGPMTISADIDSEFDIERVEFYINGRLITTDTAEPYSIQWRPIKSFWYTIKVVAIDTEGNYADDEIQIFKWRVHPLLMLGGGFLVYKLFIMKN